MSPDSSPSNIRVFIRWREQTVFAGEDIRCTITFKNVSSAPDHPPRSQANPPASWQRRTVPLHGRVNANHAGLAFPLQSDLHRTHRRSTLSLSAPSSNSHLRSGSVQWMPSAGSGYRPSPGHAHKRSVSIVSIGSASTNDEHGQPYESPAGLRRTFRGHGRTASLHSMPRGRPVLESHSAQSQRFTSSSLLNASNVSNGTLQTSTPHAHSMASRFSPRTSPRMAPEFRFPGVRASASEGQSNGALGNARVDAPQHAGAPWLNENGGGLAVPSKDVAHNHRPAAKVLSSSSAPGETPRSSGEFSSASLNSSETLPSEYATHLSFRGPDRLRPLGRGPTLTAKQSRAPESLMMAYAQIQGSFSLDGSLISLGPFEQVKLKAAVGGRGGGVVGLEQSKREGGGLLRSFGWDNIKNSLGDLLGNGELSTIKEMRGVANSKSVPLLSTPQSILFVDLELAPGESQSFEYSFRLPQGLPPTHRGKAVKISYSLVVGTQRAGGVNEQQLRSVEIPFRILGSVDHEGVVLSHDLTKPRILLRDVAEVKSLGNGTKAQEDKLAGDSAATLEDFLSYVDELMEKPRAEVGGGGGGSSSMLLPTTSTESRRPSAAGAAEMANNANEAIHLAIMRSNLTSEGQPSPNRFEIARNGQRVGVVTLARPAYRLGEVIIMAVDFSEVDIPCYAVHSTLETCERVDPSLAVRSEASIQRVTRKVYVSSSEAALYSRRVVFTPTIPISATPDFVTSGISLEWKIRVEFVVPYQGAAESPGSEDSLAPHALLEQISRDEKGGLVLGAVENLRCESFDVSVPLRVYGAIGTGLECLEQDGALVEGLIV